MAKILGNFHLALLIGVVLLLAAMFGLHREVMDGQPAERTSVLTKTQPQRL